MQKQNRITSILATALAGLFLVGCASTHRELPWAAELESSAVQRSDEYLIGARDVLSISVWRQPELSQAQVAVRPDGRISFPLIDEIEVVGMSPYALKLLLTEKLEEYVKSPHVTVVVAQVNSKFIYMLGEVRRQGQVFLTRDMRIIDALSVAGGFTEFAGKRDIKLIRTTDRDSRPAEFIFDYEDFISGRNLEQNVLLLPGDRIVVPEDKLF